MIPILGTIALVLMLVAIILLLLILITALAVLIWTTIRNRWDNWYDEAVQSSLRRR